MKPQRNQIRILIFLVSSFFLILFFQNCGKGFQSVGSNLTSNSSTMADTPSEPNPSPTTTTTLPDQQPAPAPAPMPGASCTFNGQSIASGGFVTAYKYSSVTYGGNCASQKRVCTDGILSGSYPYASCSVQPASSPSTNPYTSIDQVIASMSANSWKEIPGTMMKDVCPQPMNEYACASVIAAWSGGAFDHSRNRMLIHGGGHGDSWYNNIFSFEVQTMKWQRLNEMPPEASNKAPTHWSDIRIEPCGYYPKAPLTIPNDFMNGNYINPSKCSDDLIRSQLDFQQPRSSHTYGQFFVDSLNDRYCSIAASTFPSSQSETKVAKCLDPKTGLWSQMADRPDGVGSKGQTAADARGHIWSVPGQGGYLAEYKPSTNSWAKYGYSNYETFGASDVDRKRNHFIVLYTPPAADKYILRKIDFNSPNSLTARPIYTEVSMSGDLPTQIVESPGFVYADNKDRFFFWAGGRDVYSLNPATLEWVKHLASGDNPGPQQGNGTYGRFRYVASKGIFILVNNTHQNVLIYKP